MNLLNTQSDTATENDVSALLEHLARYRLTELAVLKRLPAFTDWRPGDLRQLLRDCERQRLIGAAPLHHAARYWFLESKGAKRLGLPEQFSGPLSEVAKLRAYAVLRYCCHSEPMRHQLTADELKQHFPTLHRPGMPNHYYFDPQGKGTIGLLRIDAGSRGRWDRSIQSLRQDISSHSLRDGFRQLALAGRFRITLVTVLPRKAKRLFDALEQHRDTQRIPVDVVALPELLPLVVPSHGKEVRTRRY
ncbi:hypothetical protein [Planctomicrobium sp. SH527]|uniref:hypothetical protein n=1 Tax=Planctomicrobium sp. SH527 TaxID=3448123 RepID=UPI003F5B0437